MPHIKGAAADALYRTGVGDAHRLGTLQNTRKAVSGVQGRASSCHGSCIPPDVQEFKLCPFCLAGVHKRQCNFCGDGVHSLHQRRESPMTDSELLAQRYERLQRDQNEVKERTCLMCGGKFMSSWMGNRICRRCKNLESDYSVERPAHRSVHHVTEASCRDKRNQEIIALRQRGVPTLTIAKQFGMAQSTVRDIVRTKCGTG